MIRKDYEAYLLESVPAKATEYLKTLDILKLFDLRKQPFIDGIKRLPDYDYVQILVNPSTKKVAVRPCKEEEKDSLRWCSASGKRTPKQITCRIFYAKIMSLMNWDANYRYKLLGKLIRSNDELLYVFDLNSAETFKRSITENGKVKTQKTPTYPDDWKNQFGLPVVEHRKSMQVNTFDNYAVFSLNPEQEKTSRSTESRGDIYE